MLEDLIDQPFSPLPLSDSQNVVHELPERYPVMLLRHGEGDFLFALDAVSEVTSNRSKSLYSTTQKLSDMYDHPSRLSLLKA